MLRAANEEENESENRSGIQDEGNCSRKRVGLEQGAFEGQTKCNAELNAVPSIYALDSLDFENKDNGRIYQHCGDVCQSCQEHSQHYHNLSKKQQKDISTKMELPGLRICYEQPRDSFDRQSCREYVSAVSEPLSSPLAEAEMHPTLMEQAISKEFIDNYCKTLNELEQRKKEILDLRNDKKELENELRKHQEHMQSHRCLASAEKRLRERIQKSLRTLADEIESTPSNVPDDMSLPETYKKLDSSEADIEYYKDQFRIYQEDFEQEREEKIKLRALNSQLTTELEEAKQTIESQQKKLLVYAQIFSNGTGAQVVIPPAYFGRRAQSSPTTPSCNQVQSFGAVRTAHPPYDTREVLHRRKAVYDPLLDIVPKGGAEKLNFARETSFSDEDGEMEISDGSIAKRRTKSIL